MLAAVPIWAALMSMPPFSVIRAATEPTMVTSRPSRIHTLPRPTTTIQWNFAQGRRSSRAGILVVMVPVCTSLLTAGSPPRIVDTAEGARHSGCSILVTVASPAPQPEREQPQQGCPPPQVLLV